MIALTADLTGRTAIVTGGSRGIGRAIALAFAGAGADVVVASRKQADLDQVVDDAKAAGLPGRVVAQVANAGEPDDAVRCVEAAMATFGAVDILVNNAATNPYFGELVDLDLARAEKTSRVNQFGLVQWTSLAWHTWMQQHGGVVLNVSSVGGITVDRGIGYYNATKAAVMHLTRQLAVELAPNVRVNCIAPGLVKTDMARALWEAKESEISARLPLRRLGVPDDIAGAALFLVSDNAAWITGQTLAVDGGALVAPLMPE